MKGKLFFYLYHIWHQICGCFHSKRFSAGCSTISFNSDPNYPKLVQTPEVRVQFHRTFPTLQMPITSYGFPGYLHFCPTWLQIRSSHDPVTKILFYYKCFLFILHFCVILRYPNHDSNLLPLITNTSLPLGFPPNFW